MRILVTGATGFIGSRLVGRLLEEGADVVAAARNPAPTLPEGVRFAQVDVTRPDTLGDAGAGCQQLVHLAALVTFDARRRAELLEVNARGTANVLEAARRWGVERCVVASSACTLGVSHSPERVLAEEDTAPAAQIAANPYLASKLEAERVAEDAARHFPVVIVNPTTVYGPGDRTLNSGTLVKQVARARVLPVPPGGSNVVDVDDVVRGILAAMARGQPGRRYVLGGQNLPFATIFDTVAVAVGRRPLMLPFPRWLRRPAVGAAWLLARATGSRFLTPSLVGELFGFKYYSSARAEAELGWRPEHAFRDSAQRAWAFYREAGLL